MVSKIDINFTARFLEITPALSCTRPWIRLRWAASISTWWLYPSPVTSARADQRNIQDIYHMKSASPRKTLRFALRYGVPGHVASLSDATD